MKFLLTFILIVFGAGYVLSRIFPWLLRLWIKRMQKRYGMDSGSGRQRAQGPSGSVHVHTDQPKKRIDKQAGEYVDFEEID
ncbi:MAG: DUF4834 family protein [Bacteroidales bacterium]|nr:DUF4834 family protein [Bacteroidales bacterium]MCL2737977.1 DUF4834 family protein [Bacteroidales bacterium]